MSKKFVLFLIFALAYLLRLYFVPNYQIPEDKAVTVVGRITQQPYLSGSYQNIKLDRVTLKNERFPGYFYSQTIAVTGKFQKRVTNPFFNEFIAYHPTIRELKIETDSSSLMDLTPILYKTRGQVESKISVFLPEPENGLLLGVLLGSKSKITQNFFQKLRETGTLHLVVVSGQNVTMLSWFLMELLIFFISRRTAIIIACLALLIYVLFTGAEPPVVRAGMMVVFSFLAQIVGRENESIRGLLLAAGIILLVEPLILFDIGFQLSFAAMTGILLFYPKLKVLADFPPLAIFVEAFLTTVSAQLVTLPILLTNFGQFSFLSPLVNTLILPTIPFIMILGGLLAGSAVVFQPLAQILAWASWPFLAWFVAVVEGFGRLPLANYEIGKLSLWWGAGYYALLVFIYVRFLKNRNERIEVA